MLSQRERNSWSLLVVDDQPSFALHVFRFLSRSLGIGNGAVQLRGERAEGFDRKVWLEPATRLASDDGAFELFWIPAATGWKKSLQAAVRQATGKILVIADVMGKRKSDYEVSLVLAQVPPRREIRVVSAYHAVDLIGAHPVRPKSLETLREIRGLIYPQPGVAEAAEGAVRHILVTGAGFEIRGERGGFGVPRTQELLEQMTIDGIRFGWREGIPFPAPMKLGDIWSKALLTRLKQKDLGLDLYWDILLEEAIYKLLSKERNDRETRKREALENEKKLRGAFRNSILQYDWGHLNQALIAADLKWHVWLTTNYTRFVNRALRGKETWQIVSTADEARSTLREGTGKTRYLFKLHGDIAHLNTMALAGHDKEPSSPLGLAMEDIYEVYAAAENFLRRSLDREEEEGRNGEKRKKVTVYWHVVGHALGDQQLVSLINRVSKSSSSSHYLIAVDLLARDPKFRARIRSRFKWLKDPMSFVQLTASQYMERLKHSGCLHDKVEGLRSWLADLERRSRA